MLYNISNDNVIIYIYIEYMYASFFKLFISVCFSIVYTKQLDSMWVWACLAAQLVSHHIS